MSVVLTLLREARWLDASRVRGYAVIVGLASVALLAVSYVAAMGPEGTDFLAFWGAGNVTAAGDPAAAYDLAVQERIQTATGSEGWFAFVNPPPFLFAVTPFGALHFPVAWIAWVAATYSLFAWVGIRAFPRLWPLVLAFPGALIAAGHGQNGLLTGALLITGVTLADRRPLLAGAAIGALIVKPHLALLLPFWLAAGARWKVFITAGITALALLGASCLAFGSATFAAYAESWSASAALMRAGEAEFWLRMATPYAQMRLVLAAEAALAIQGMVALGMLALVAISWRRFGGDAQATGAFALAATAVASPYLFNYDLPFLLLPVLWLLREGLHAGFRPYEKLALVALWFAPYATRAVALPLGINLMPLAAITLAALVWTRAVTARTQA